jgi:hypothetical protein
VSDVLAKIKRFFRRMETSVEETAEGGEPVGPNADRETSTDAEVEGASGEPWTGDR